MSNFSARWYSSYRAMLVVIVLRTSFVCVCSLVVCRASIATKGGEVLPPWYCRSQYRYGATKFKSRLGAELQNMDLIRGLTSG